MPPKAHFGDGNPTIRHEIGISSTESQNVSLLGSKKYLQTPGQTKSRSAEQHRTPRQKSYIRSRKAEIQLFPQRKIDIYGISEYIRVGNP
jgi:hypothetical protein